MKVLLTGASGFVGWHTRVRLRALTDHTVVVATRDSWADLDDLARDADAVIHVAGVNRGTPSQVERGNIELAGSLAETVRATGTIRHVVYANSIHTGSPTPYGLGKGAAGDVLAAAAAATGATYVDVRLPNLFGEHGRPHYNSFVATFVDAVAGHVAPEIADRAVDLLHAQDAAQSLIDGLTTTEPVREPAGTPTSVRAVLDLLTSFADLYARGDIPPLTAKLEVDLFNTFRAALFPARYPIALAVREDDRGRLVETVRAHAGQGQTFVSTTTPGLTRGDHFHLQKVERFVVLGGRARISLRRMFTDQVVSFDVRGDEPVVVDMPTMWAHNITNTGATELTTLFWAHPLFDPDAPDTFREPVHVGVQVPA